MANMEITINATPPSPDPPAPSPPAAITSSPTNRTSSEAQEGDEEGRNKKVEWVKEWRGWLMAAASFFASVTFQAGLNPPGGFWQDDLQSSDFTQGYKAGNPVLATKNPNRYIMFLIFDTLAFVISLLIIGLLLLEPSFIHEELRLNLIQKFLGMVFISVGAAFTVGTCHDFQSYVVPVSSTIIILIFILILSVKWEMRWSKRNKLSLPDKSVETVGIWPKTAGPQEMSEQEILAAQSPLAVEEV